MARKKLTGNRKGPSIAKFQHCCSQLNSDTYSLMEGKKVLVVEDNVVNRRVALKMLGSLGCQVQVILVTLGTAFIVVLLEGVITDGERRC